MVGRKSFWVLAGLVLLAVLAVKAPAAADGFLYVTSIPDKAIIKIDGETQGSAPLSVSLPKGQYFLEAALDSYKAAGKKVDVAEGEVTRVEFKLEKSTVASKTAVAPVSAAKGKGNITFVTDWTGAEIYLDGARIKETTPATLKGISAGLHSVILVNKGYSVYRQFTLRDQETQVVKESFQQVKDNLTVAAAETNLATVNLNLTATNPKKSSKNSSGLWDQNDLISVVFQYRKPGAADWTTSELQAASKEADSFTVEKGTYEIQIVATHYKVTSGLLTVLGGAEKKKVAEAKQSFTKDFAAGKIYTFSLNYDGSFDLTYKVTEETQSVK